MLVSFTEMTKIASGKLPTAIVFSEQFAKSHPRGYDFRRRGLEVVYVPKTLVWEGHHRVDQTFALVARLMVRSNDTHFDRKERVWCSATAERILRDIGFEVTT